MTNVTIWQKDLSIKLGFEDGKILQRTFDTKAEMEIAYASIIEYIIRLDGTIIHG